MNIKFINHASVIFECEDVKILTDPWYCGSPFNNGWDLLVEKDIDINSLDFNYLWYSHEHPDHFSIADIKKISNDKRKNITILFQKAPDQKVKGFCENLGFKVMELENNKTYNIKDVEITCSPVGGFDSWLSLTFKGKTILNVNDCRIETTQELLNLKKQVGKIDVLMTQFGWANWIGNKNDKDAIQISKDMVYHKLDNQIDILNPEFIIPFASFSWFSHAENNHCNDDIITVQDFIDRYPDENIITMYIDDEWVVGEDKDCSDSIQKWTDAYSITKLPKHNSTSISMEKLQQSFLDMKQKIQKDNDWNSILALKKEGVLQASLIHITDLNKTISFDITRDTLIEVDIDYNIKKSQIYWSGSPDLHLSSDSLNYAMKFSWGRGTLTVNGRFQANYHTFYRFLRQTHIYYGNNIGKNYPDDITKEEIINPKCLVLETISKRKMYSSVV